MTDISPPPEDENIHPTSGEVLIEAHKMTDDLEKKTSKRQEGIIITLTIMCIVEILLVFGVIVAVTNNQNTQTIVNSQVLCPLYETLKASESPAARKVSTNKVIYDQLVQEVQHSIAVLGCTQP